MALPLRTFSKVFLFTLLIVGVGAGFYISSWFSEIPDTVNENIPEEQIREETNLVAEESIAVKQVSSDEVDAILQQDHQAGLLDAKIDFVNTLIADFSSDGSGNIPVYYAYEGELYDLTPLALLSFPMEELVKVRKFVETELAAQEAE